MATTRFSQPDLRKPAGSPIPKGRENARDTLCRNVLIYGHCRFEVQGCAFNHDSSKTFTGTQESALSPAKESIPDTNLALVAPGKKGLSFNSPAFTPSTIPAGPKTSSIPSQSASAAPFTPRGQNNTVSLSKGASPKIHDSECVVPLNPTAVKEFTPASFDIPQPLISNESTTDSSFDPFTLNTLSRALPTTPYNPYLDENSNIANQGTYFQAQPSFSASTQPLQYHLYAPIGPHREDLLAYQRLTHDFFILNSIRETLQKRSEALHQVIPNSQLPTVDHYHTLVPLDTNHHENATVFGYPSWVYKAVSSKNGNTYVLRRLKGYRLSNEKAIRSVNDWKRVDNSGVVSVIDAFTTRAFGDSSLIFVCNYHPLSKTLVEHHFNNTSRFCNRGGHTAIPEQILWSYIVQIASAIKSIHEAKLAVRCMDLSKIIVTDKNRIRLNACSIYDVINFESIQSLHELQQEDFILFGKLILSLASNNINTSSQPKSVVDHLARAYSVELRDSITWLLTPSSLPSAKNINDFIRGISTHFVAAYDSSLHAIDSLTSTLCTELENGRLFRLMAKLGAINERPEYEGDIKWSEVGERYILKLFRDYVFHQVDAHGKPILNLAHIIENLNKLDAGCAQQVKLTSRDDQDCMYVSYRELKKQIEAAFSELINWGEKRY